MEIYLEEKEVEKIFNYYLLEKMYGLQIEVDEITNEDAGVVRMLTRPISAASEE